MNTQHPSPKTGKSQAARILKVLMANRRKWVPMGWLARVGSGRVYGFCMVHSRIADLRRAGHNIENKVERNSGQAHSYYQLL